MSNATRSLDKVTIIFAGDSGDGIQLAGFEFSNTAALFGNDLSTFPDFPAEIRAPQGTVSGVSGFKINFGNQEIFTPGGLADVLVVMNAAALKKNLDFLKPNGLIVANTAGFDARNLKLAGFPADANPLEKAKQHARVISLDVTRLTREALVSSNLSMKERDRARNMFVLGFVYWIYHRDITHTENFLRDKFRKSPDVAESNIMVLKAGYHYGETVEAGTERFAINPAKLPPGEYRNIMGNQGTAIGLIVAAKKANLPLYYAGYPITPASDILHELSKHKNFGIKTFQAEDEIAAVTAAIGASFGGSLAITASSGPGIALKAEALGLAVMLEIPLVIVNVQRGGPSTGLPTKTEQADLLQALYGRNGEAPIPVIAAKSPRDTFFAAFEACRVAIEHMTPVFLLSDGYIGNGAEPWRFPNPDDLPKITAPIIPEKGTENYLPYRRDEKGVRQWAIPGTPGLEHRIGGLEKEDESGNVSYDPENHQKMVHLRKQKIEAIPVPDVEIVEGGPTGDVLILGWGSTYGAIRVATRNLRNAGHSVSNLHLSWIYPLPQNLESIFSGFKHILVPELNMGQLIKVVRSEFSRKFTPLNKVKGLPFLAVEIENSALKLLENK